MFIKEGTGVCTANPTKLEKPKNAEGEMNESAEKKFVKNEKCKRVKCTTMSDSFPQSSSEQPDYTFES